MNRCPECNTRTFLTTCPKCGHPFVSVAEDTLDALIEQASKPDLAALYKQGKESGLIQAVIEYAST